MILFFFALKSEIIADQVGYWFAHVLRANQLPTGATDAESVLRAKQ